MLNLVIVLLNPSILPELGQFFSDVVFFVLFLSALK